MYLKYTHMNHTKKTNNGAALLVDMVVAIAIFGVIFGGVLNGLKSIAAAQIELKARLAATFLMTQQFEKAESIDYAVIGTVGATGGAPVGIFPVTEVVNENNTAFTRVIGVLYVDNPKDGLAESDANGKPNDYKHMSVTVSWSLKGAARSVSSSRFYAPPGIEP
jgi:type II secretory pathway pseudopilin PulG